MLINFIDKSCAKILLFLAVSPGSNYRRNEIKDKIQLNNVTLDIALNKLIAFNIPQQIQVYPLASQSSISVIRDAELLVNS